MRTRRILGLIAMLLTTRALVDAPSVEARERRCRSDKQCKDGTCNDAGRCCSTFAGEVACGTACCNVLLGEACCGAHECVDILHEQNNCGGCGIVCSGGKACQNGSCHCPSTHPTECNGSCHNTTYDPDNCGTCGNACPADKDCVAGSCENLCPPCEVFQDGACVPKECACGTCDPTTDQCVSTCGGGQVCCSNTCVSPRVPGDGAVCCAWNGNPYACGPGEQCAGAFGCCSAGTEVCEGANGAAQCCSGALVCQAGRCCVPDGVLGCPCGSCTGCCNRTN
jgi:hypothetical protein